MLQNEDVKSFLKSQSSTVPWNQLGQCGQLVNAPSLGLSEEDAVCAAAKLLDARFKYFTDQELTQRYLDKLSKSYIDEPCELLFSTIYSWMFEFYAPYGKEVVVFAPNYWQNK